MVCVRACPPLSSLIVQGSPLLEPTLSVLVPVYNAQRALGPILAQLVEVLPDISPQFEMLVIDDGSTDATPEVAQEMAADYPQIGFVAHPSRLGMAAAVRTGLARSSGEMVLVRDEECRADLYDIPKLWRHANMHDIVLGRVPSQSIAGTIPRLPINVATRTPTELRPPLQLLHRRVTRGWLTLGGHEELLVHLARKGYPMMEVEVRDRQPMADPAMIAEKIAQRWLTPVSGTAAMVQPKIMEPRRPNYLAKLKAFALGE